MITDDGSQSPALSLSGCCCGNIENGSCKYKKVEFDQSDNSGYNVLSCNLYQGCFYNDRQLLNK